MSTTPHRLKKRNVTSLQTFCSILPSHDPVLSEEVFAVTEESVTFPDSKLENTSTFKFNHVFNGFRELQNAFEKAYSPLIRTVNNGENVLLVYGGLPISESMDFFTSMNGRVGLINQAAQLLLRSNTISSSNTNNTLTLSWYKIESKGTENITDLLRMSSSLHAEKPSEGSSLILRELGKGRGMVVPGLWEVEVSKPQDVDSVISHVQRMVPYAKHDGESHSVVQLIVTPNTVSHDNTSASSKSNVLKEDAPGVGRLTFVLLSNLCPPRSPDVAAQKSYHHVELFPWVNQLEDVLCWVESKRPSPPFHKSRILLLLRDALCNRIGCGISLFMQPTVAALTENAMWLSLISHISAVNADRTTAISTLPIHPHTAAKVASVSNNNSEQTMLYSTSYSTTPNASTKNKQSVSKRPGGGGGVLKQAAGSHQDARRPQPQSHQPQQSNRQTPRAGSSRLNAEHNEDDIFQRMSQSEDIYMSSPYSPKDNVHALSRDFDRQSSRNHQVSDIPLSPSEDEDLHRQQQLHQHQLNYQRQFYENQSKQSKTPSTQRAPQSQGGPGGAPPPPSTNLQNQNSIVKKRNTEVQRQQSNSQYIQSQEHATHTAHQQSSQSIIKSRHIQAQHLLSPPPPPANSFPTHQEEKLYVNSFIPPQVNNFGQLLEDEENTRPPENKSDRTASAEKSIKLVKSSSLPTSSNDLKDAETVQALLMSLQSSRNEVEALEKSLQLAQQSVEFHKQECEALRNIQVKEGQTLKLKDRDRLKKALQELKDYEVYREVMEAAMSRMQNEIDKLEGDNNDHKDLTSQLEKELRKSKAITNKITKETSEFEKSKEALYDRVKKAEDEAKRLSREKDAAVLALSQFKAEKARDEEDLISSRRVKHKEVLELKKKLADINMQFKTSSEEADAASLLHAQEMKKLQTAHKKSLEMLMACQEENDLLRAAVAELEEEKAKRLAQSTSSLKHPSRARSPLSNIFQNGGNDDDEYLDHDDEKDISSTGNDKSNDQSNSEKSRRKTIVFVDDYENGDIYIEDDSSSLTEHEDSANIEIVPKVVVAERGSQSEPPQINKKDSSKGNRNKSISFAVDSNSDD